MRSSRVEPDGTMLANRQLSWTLNLHVAAIPQPFRRTGRFSYCGCGSQCWCPVFRQQVLSVKFYNACPNSSIVSCYVSHVLWPRDHVDSQCKSFYFFVHEIIENVSLASEFQIQSSEQYRHR